MLNICMDRRRIREGNLSFAMTTANRKIGNESHSDGSDDEFFDCDANNEMDESKQHHYAPWNKPEGRLSKLNDMKLIDSEEYLYVPITQEPVPKTEDQLEDDAEVMLKLGPGSELRAQIMSASLLSDMESFKAANPNGKLEDFIRWYSPRDWIEDDDNGKHIHLSIDPMHSYSVRISYNSCDGCERRHEPTEERPAQLTYAFARQYMANGLGGIETRSSQTPGKNFTFDKTNYAI